jgi:hypothetical protein
MRVQINEAGRDDETRGVENFRAFGHAVVVRHECRDAPVFNQ